MKKQEFFGDLVVVLSADSRGVLTTGGFRVYVKIGKVYEQIGLLEKFKISADAKKNAVQAEATLWALPDPPKKSLQIIQRRLKALSKFSNLKMNVTRLPKRK